MAYNLKPKYTLASDDERKQESTARNARIHSTLMLLCAINDGLLCKQASMRHRFGLRQVHTAPLPDINHVTQKWASPKTRGWPAAIVVSL
jgi:hypothetical protein